MDTCKFPFRADVFLRFHGCVLLNLQMKVVDSISLSYTNCPEEKLGGSPSVPIPFLFSVIL